MRLVFYIRTVNFAFFLFLSAVISGQTGKSYTYAFDVNVLPEPVAAEGNSMLINYYINELILEEVENESGLFYRINIPGHTPSYDIGNPEVPVLSRIITIPDGADVKVKITEVKSVRLHPSSKKIKGILYPSQESESKSLTQRGREFLSYCLPLFIGKPIKIECMCE